MLSWRSLLARSRPAAPWIIRSHKCHSSSRMEAVDQKAASRTRIKQLLKTLSPEDMAQQSKAIADRVLNSSFFSNSRSMGLYVTCERLREVDTQQLLEAALAAGKRCYVPLVEDRNSNMSLLAIDGLQDLRPVPPFGILEPLPCTPDGAQREDALTAPAPLELLLMPGLGFNAHGGRLGRGGGYYDKMVEQLEARAQQLAVAPPLLVGLSFEQQLVEEDLPMSTHDRPVDVVVTPSSIHVCSGALQQRGWA